MDDSMVMLRGDKRFIDEFVQSLKNFSFALGMEIK